MALNTQSFTTIVQNTVAAIQGAATALVDLTVGSVLLAITQANAAIALWLQGLILQVAALTRFATSNGADADAWAADFGFARLPAQPAEGQVTFTRFTPTQQAVIPVGALVQTADGTQQYAVIADTTESAYNALLSAYIISPGSASCTATVQAVTAGAASNAIAGYINTLSQSIPYVDTVTNAAGFTDGADAESDTAFRARFVTYIGSLSKATKAAVANAIMSIQQGLSYTLVEDQSYAGVAEPGYFYVVVDDGTGYPSSTLLSTVSNAIDAVRPVCSTFGVFAPVVETAACAMTLTTAPGYTHASVVAVVQAALLTYINSLPLGSSLPYSRLAQVAYDASPGVINVTGVTLNGGAADLAASSQQVIKAGALSVA